ncbi:hypothetical protein ACWDSD_20050 [Streptomyces spiralis]
MTHKIARRAAVAVSSAAVAVAGLIATGGTASAATLPGGGQSGLVRVADGHDEDARRQWVMGQIQWAADGHDQDARQQWVIGQIQWAADGHDQDARQQWVMGQIQWAQEHGLSA